MNEGNLGAFFFLHSFYLLVSDCIKESREYIANGFDLKIISYNGF